jgi:hypothetical protein
MLSLYSYVIKKKEKSKKIIRRWQAQLFKRRNKPTTNNSTVLTDIKFQEINEQYTKFTRMSLTNFEYLINLIRPKEAEQDTFL